MRYNWRKTWGGLTAASVLTATVCMVALAGPLAGGKKVDVPTSLPDTSSAPAQPSAEPAQLPTPLPNAIDDRGQETRFLRQPNWLNDGDCSVLEGPYLV